MNRNSTRAAVAMAAAIATATHASVDPITQTLILPSLDAPVPHEYRGEIHAFNDSRLDEGHFVQPLTEFAVGGWNRTDLEEELQFLCPEVSVPRRFSYRVFSNAEQFYSDPNEDLREIGGDFKRVEMTSTKVEAKTLNRGLCVFLDDDEIEDDPGWEQRNVSMLIRRIKLNAIRRAMALISATAVSTNRTWSTPGNTIDPDNDIRVSLKTAQNLSGLRPNRVIYGQTAADLRFGCYRTDGNAARFLSSAATMEQWKNTLAVEAIRVSETRYQSTTSAKAEVLGSNVLSFYQTNSPSKEDPSNIKRFVSQCKGGGPLRVFKYKIGDKTNVIGVEHYELLTATYASGVRLDVIG